MRTRGLIALVFIFGLCVAAMCPALAHSPYFSDAQLVSVAGSPNEAWSGPGRQATFVEFLWVNFSWPRDRWAIGAIIALANAIALGIWQFRPRLTIKNRVLSILAHCGVLMCKVSVVLIAFAVLAHPLFFGDVPVKDWFIALYIGFVPLVATIIFRAVRRQLNARRPSPRELSS